MLDLLLLNLTLPDGRVVDLQVRDGIVVHAGAGAPAHQTLDCRGLLVLPAAIDMHVHMRGGTQSVKEDWTTGSQSALAGGVTVVVDQPNTVPPITNREHFKVRVADATAHSYCGFGVNGAVTRDARIADLWQGGALAFGEVFIAPSSYGEALTLEVQQRTFAEIHRLGGLVTVHAEEVSGTAPVGLRQHSLQRSPAGEERAVQALRASCAPGQRVHCCHMSTAGSLDAAHRAGMTAEVTPHHLLLSIERFADTDTHGRVNPPLRSERLQRELFLAWDRIDLIASDHAPHTLNEKAQAFTNAPSGLPGVETMVPLLMAHVLTSELSLASVVQKTAVAPAKVLGIPPAGFSPGDRADFALYPREAVPVEAADLHSRCTWTPYQGMLAVFPERVIMRGTVVYDHGDFTRIDPCWYRGRGYMERPQI
ncbi:dihydroorotase [Methanosphaerula palustris]|uniref:Dihydroorotase, multifunctional complex type n=1 Tax=Methanosphaerula palustris (strain ATCC BAA-1556 / DSM 19958 / E1-9c) TaxID=521011 RepID=B8GJK0_METPE|nr:dihydroorotase [Methanosphaerula palustris]ACL17041.1 dihydroorotase, multifunctional complex type [Methanosphaerula palustris E1-9c]